MSNPTLRLSEHHPNCAVTRQGNIRAFCDCKWPEVRASEREVIIDWLISLDKESGDINRFLPTTLANWIGERMHEL